MTTPPIWLSNLIKKNVRSNQVSPFIKSRETETSTSISIKSCFLYHVCAALFQNNKQNLFLEALIRPFHNPTHLSVKVKKSNYKLLKLHSTSVTNNDKPLYAWCNLGTIFLWKVRTMKYSNAIYYTHQVHQHIFRMNFYRAK